LHRRNNKEQSFVDHTQLHVFGIFKIPSSFGLGKLLIGREHFADARGISRMNLLKKLRKDGPKGITTLMVILGEYHKVSSGLQSFLDSTKDMMYFPGIENFLHSI
jgi:hypothetical protein